MGQITVTVDLDDLYAEEDGGFNFNEIIKENIALEVKRLTYEDFKKEAMPSFEIQVKRKIDLDRDLKIKEQIDALFEKPELKTNYYDKEKVSLTQYIENYFAGYTLNSRDFNDRIEALVKKQGQEITQQLKDRYDLLFASQIVTKLNEQGMLKEDIAKILLGDGKNN
jgi:hypothetical protein